MEKRKEKTDKSEEIEESRREEIKVKRKDEEGT